MAIRKRFVRMSPRPPTGRLAILNIALDKFAFEPYHGRAVRLMQAQRALTGFLYQVEC